LARDAREPFDLWMSTMCAATRALLQGRYFEGEKRSMEAMSIAWRLPGQQSHEDNAGLSFTGQLFIARREVGGSEDLLELVEYMRLRYPTLPIMSALVMALLLDRGRCDEARCHFEDLAADEFSTIPRDAVWTATCALLAEACFAFQDRARAATLYDLLTPYADQNTSVASTGSLGALARYLGILAATLGRHADAMAHFAAALAINERMGARPWLAYTQHDLALLLRRDGAPDARVRARELLRLAGETARDLGMRRLAAAVSRAVALGDAPPISPAAAQRDAGTWPPHGNVLRREGEYWTIMFEGEVLRLRDSKGVLFLAHLLRHPGREFHATDLVTGTAESIAARTVYVDPSRYAGDHLAVGGPELGFSALDSRAKEAYRARVADLRRELEEAHAYGDPARVIRLQEELDFVTHEIARSVGIGGRDRMVGSAAERARLNVTRAIRTTLSRIAVHHGALGKHLGRTVRTGMFCSYAVDPRTATQWVVETAPWVAVASTAPCAVHPD
jgi:tetratricopeptide (TPR) repeat protein